MVGLLKVGAKGVERGGCSRSFIEVGPIGLGDSIGHEG